MNTADPSSAQAIERHAARLTELELQTMHLQRDLETINEVVLEQRREIDNLNESMRQVSNRFDSYQPKEENDPADERPPHY